jgi:hypothetical protein
MKGKNSNLIDKVILSLDWDTIFEVNKCFKVGVGEGISGIPGLKRKPFLAGITKNDIKNELKNLLKHVIENDISEFIYGHWMIFWNNAEWSLEELNKIKDEMDDDDDYYDEHLIIDSTLEVIYSPQRAIAMEPVPITSIGTDDSDETKLEEMLKKALQNEHYELASKIRDVLKIQKNQQ